MHSVVMVQFITELRSHHTFSMWMHSIKSHDLEFAQANTTAELVSDFCGSAERQNWLTGKN